MKRRSVSLMFGSFLDLEQIEDKAVLLSVEQFTNIGNSNPNVFLGITAGKDLSTLLHANLLHGRLMDKTYKPHVGEIVLAEKIEFNDTSEIESMHGRKNLFINEVASRHLPSIYKAIFGVEDTEVSQREMRALICEAFEEDAGEALARLKESEEFKDVEIVRFKMQLDLKGMYGTRSNGDHVTVYATMNPESDYFKAVRLSTLPDQEKYKKVYIKMGDKLVEKERTFQGKF